MDEKYHECEKIAHEHPSFMNERPSFMNECEKNGDELHETYEHFM